MKRAVFLHGTNGSPSDHWWPWLREKFEASGYEVWAPLLPDNDRPNQQTYWQFLSNQDWDFRDNVLVGHSSGATVILNLLSDRGFPKVSNVVLAGTFLNQSLTQHIEGFSPELFKDLFPSQGFDWEMIKSKADKFYFVHADDDPYCSYDDAIHACRIVSGEMITVPHGGHLSTNFGVTELPQLITSLQRDAVI